MNFGFKSNAIFPVYMLNYEGSFDHFMYAPIKWETVLQCYSVTTSPIGWAQAHYDPWTKLLLSKYSNKTSNLHLRATLHQTLHCKSDMMFIMSGYYIAPVKHDD